MVRGVNDRGEHNLLGTSVVFETAASVVPPHLVTIRAIDYVQSHLSCSLDGATVAAALGVSRKTLCKHFKNDTGETFGRFVRSNRVTCACQLLETTDLDIAQIAYQTGFSSQSHLHTAFKRATGLTPRQWRAKSRTR